LAGGAPTVITVLSPELLMSSGLSLIEPGEVLSVDFVTGVFAALWVPRMSSTSCDQAVFVDQVADASVPSDTVLLKINRFG
jgi:hypothetical protein